MIDELNNENVTMFLRCLDANYIRNSNFTKSQVDNLLSISKNQFMFLLYFKNFSNCVPHLLESVHIKKNLEYENRIDKKIIYGRRVIEALNISGRPCYLIKGISNSKYIFDSIYHRDFSDFDLIVRSEDFYYANRILLGMGAKSNLGENFVDFASIQTHEVRYEVEPNIYIEIKVCPSCILDLDTIEHMCQTSITMEIANFDYLTFDLENSFILLCANLYSNYTSEFGKVKIRDIIDTYLFMSAQILNIDLDLFYSRLAKYGLEKIVLSAIAFVDLFFYKLKSSFLLEITKSSSDVQLYKKVTMEHFGAVDNNSFISIVLAMSNSQGQFLLQHYKNELKKNYVTPEISLDDGKCKATQRIRSQYFNIDISFHFITKGKCCGELIVDGMAKIDDSFDAFILIYHSNSESYRTRIKITKNKYELIEGVDGVVTSYCEDFNERRMIFNLDHFKEFLLEKKLVIKFYVTKTYNNGATYAIGNSLYD